MTWIEDQQEVYGTHIVVVGCLESVQTGLGYLEGIHSDFILSTFAVCGREKRGDVSDDVGSDLGVQGARERAERGSRSESRARHRLDSARLSRGQRASDRRHDHSLACAPGGTGVTCLRSAQTVDARIDVDVIESKTKRNGRD